MMAGLSVLPNTLLLLRTMPMVPSAWLWCRRRRRRRCWRGDAEAAAHLGLGADGTAGTVVTTDHAWECW